MKTTFERTVGEIRKGNLFATENSSAFDAAMELLENGDAGLPVLDRKGRVVGIVGSADLLRAVRDPRRMEEIRVKEVMTRSPIVIEEGTTLAAASKLMEDALVDRLPVVKEGVFIGTVTRHDLLRAWLDVGEFD
ncbi:MAG: CBS domain-containing protein [Candidatus Manganitrophaceae bacterium]